MTTVSEFPIGFPWGGSVALLTRDDVDPDGLGLPYEHRVDVCAAGLELLLGQFADKPRMRALACGLLDGIQDAENAAWQLLTERWIDTGTGSQLDGIGLVLEMPRAGRTDLTYRAFLRARVLVLRSDGSWPAMLAVCRAIGLTMAGSGVTYTGEYPAAVTVRVLDTLPDEVSGRDVFQMLDAAKTGGVRLTVIAPAAPIGETFRLASAAATVIDAALGLGSVGDADLGGRLAGVDSTSVEV